MVEAVGIPHRSEGCRHVGHVHPGGALASGPPSRGGRPCGLRPLAGRCLAGAGERRRCVACRRLAARPTAGGGGGGGGGGSPDYGSQCVVHGAHGTPTAHCVQPLI